MTINFWMNVLYFALLTRMTLGNKPALSKVLAASAIAIFGVFLAIARGADMKGVEGSPVWGMVMAVMFAMTAASEYWRLFHEAADQASKWAWREWRTKEVRQ